MMFLKFTDMTSSPIFFSLSNSLFIFWFVVVVEFCDICKSENENVVGQMTEIGENPVSNILGLGQASDKKLDMGTSNEYLLTLTK